MEHRYSSRVVVAADVVYSVDSGWLFGRVLDMGTRGALTLARIPYHDTRR